MKTIKLYISILFFVTTLAVPLFVNAETTVVRDILFPVSGPNNFSDTFGAARFGGRSHIGTDIIADKMTTLVAVTDGYISYLTEDEPYWGYSLTIKDNDGYQYKYLHINNDTPGTDDGQGGRTYAFFPTIQKGIKVVAGQPIAYVGDSGNAESTISHLHFELWTPEKVAVNPYASLIAAEIGKVPSWSYQFNSDLEYGNRYDDVLQLQKYLNANGFTVSVSGAGSAGNETTYFGSATKTALIEFQKYYKINPAAGYFGSITRTLINNSAPTNDPNSGQEETTAQIKTPTKVIEIASGWLVKNVKFAEVFYVTENLTLRWIVDEQAAERHFGSNWNKDIREFEDLGSLGLKFGESLN